MNSFRRSVSLPLLLVVLFVFSSLWSASEGTVAAPQAAERGESHSSRSPGNQSPALFAVEEKGKYGFIDSAGKMVISPKYSSTQPFSEGLAAVTVGRKTGYIDETGTVVIPPKYSWTFRFSEGLSRVSLGKKWGYIDKTGQMIIQPQYSGADDFSDGLAAVQIRGKWGYIDKNGHMVIPAERRRPFPRRGGRRDDWR